MLEAWQRGGVPIFVPLGVEFRDVPVPHALIEIRR
jgi:hypothetical protein